MCGSSATAPLDATLVDPALTIESITLLHSTGCPTGQLPRCERRGALARREGASSPNPKVALVHAHFEGPVYRSSEPICGYQDVHRLKRWLVFALALLLDGRSPRAGLVGHWRDAT